MLEFIRATKMRENHRIEISLHDINQLFNTLDPSPFYEKDLDNDAEEFIVSWAREFPREDCFTLDIHLGKELEPSKPPHVIEQAVQHYFLYRAKLIRLEFRRLMREARLTLLIGLIFFFVCLTGARFSEVFLWTAAVAPVREGLVICGWVAMWRPLQMYLYDWWPIRRRLKIYEKLSRMKITVKQE